MRTFFKYAHIKNNKILNYIYFNRNAQFYTYLRNPVSDRSDTSFVMSNDTLLRNNYFICKERLIVINANSLTSIPDSIEKHLRQEIDLRRIKPRCFG